MAIDSTCTGCNKTLRVSDEHAGKNARCPHCGTVYTVPSGPAASPSQAGSHHSAAPTSSTTERWLVRSDAGQVYGPATGNELQNWVNEGRLTAKSQLQLEGTSEWLPATKRFPNLAGNTAQNFDDPKTSSNPFADKPSDNPYVSPHASSFEQSYPQQTGAIMRPHRGGVVLALGIIGLCSCFSGFCCGLLGLPGLVCGTLAWIFGAADLKEMRANRMDRSGESITQVGMILGIVCCVLGVLGVLMYLGAIVFQLIVDM